MAESVEEKFRRWKNRVDVGRKLNQDKEESEWSKYVDAYEGKIARKNASDTYEVNLQYVDVRSSVPKLYSQNPYIYIDPLTPESDLNSEILEKVVNAKTKDWKLKERMRALIKGAKLKGRAYLKVSYKFDRDKIAREYIGEEPNDEISIAFIDRKNLIIDRNASSVESARWVAHEIEAPIAEIRKKFNLRDDDRPVIREEKCTPENIPSEEKEDFQFGRYFEIEDRENHTLAIIVDGVNRFVVKPYPHPYAFHSMYEPLEWNDIPGNQDTKADLHFWYKQLVDLADSKTKQFRHRRKLNSKYILQTPKPLTEEQKASLTSYEDAIVAELPIGANIIPHNHAQLGQEIYLGEQSTRQDITIISGMNEMKQGLPQAQKTAREAMAIVQEAQDVMSDRSGVIEDVVSKVIDKCIWLIQNFYDSTRVIELSGMDEGELLGLKEKFGGRISGDARHPFFSFVGKELTGKMRVRVKAGSAAPVNEAQRRNDLMTLVQFMGQSQQLAAAVDSKELIKEIAKILHIENKGIIYDAKSPEQENSLLKRNIPVMPNINEPHEIHLAAHELENNNTPAFLQHLFGHRLLKSFIDKSKMAAAQPPVQMQSGPGGLSQENIGGLPMGSSLPVAGLPQQGPAPVQAVQQPPAIPGIQ